MYEYYELLGVDQSADTEEIEAAFRERIRNRHPDQDGDSEAVLELKRAREVLTDPALRKDYDRLGHRKFVERERGGTARNVDLRSTDDGRDRSERKRSRTHTRPRGEDTDRGRTDDGGRRNRSPDNAGPSRGSADQRRSSEESVHPSDPPTSSDDAVRPSEDSTHSSDPERTYGSADSPNADSTGAGTVKDGSETVERDHSHADQPGTDGYDSVVDLDEVADVGSVDPDEVLNDTTIGAPEEQPDQRDEFEPTGEHSDSPSDEGRSTTVEDPTPTESEGRSQPAGDGPRDPTPETEHDTGNDSRSDPQSSQKGTGTRPSDGPPDPDVENDTTTSSDPDPDPYGYDNPEPDSQTSEGIDEAPDEHGTGDARDSLASEDPLAGPGSEDSPRMPPEASDDAPGEHRVSNSGTDSDTETVETTGNEDPLGAMDSGRDDPSDGNAGGSPVGAADETGREDTEDQGFGDARGAADIGAADEAGGESPSNDPAGFGAANEAGGDNLSNDPAGLGAANGTGGGDPSSDTVGGGPTNGTASPAEAADPIGAGPPDETGGEGDPLAGPSGTEPASPAGNGSSSDDAPDDGAGGEAFGMAGTTETDGGEPASAGPVGRVVGGVLAVPAALLGAVPSPGIGSKLDALKAVFGDQYRSDAVDQMSRYAWIGRGVIAVVLWALLSILAPDTGLVPTASPTALGVIAVSLGVAFLAYDLILLFVADLEPGCHGPATEDAPISGVAGVVVLYALAVGTLAAVVIDAPGLVSAVTDADTNAVATAVMDQPYHAVGGAAASITTVVALVALFVASLHLPWSDRFDRGYHVLPGLWQLPIPVVVLALAWSSLTGGTVPVPSVAMTLDRVAFAAAAGLLPIIPAIYLVRRRLESPQSRTTF